jgi:hypothetical protein
MGISRFKKTIDCTCGCDYGNDCGKKQVFLFCYNRSVDIGTLYIDGERVFCLTDEGLNAVVDVLGPGDNKEKLTEEERKLI